MNRKENFTAGFIRENPVFSLYLGLCSTLAITTSLNNAIGMGVAVIIVLIMSNVIISLVRNITPNEIRIPVYIVIIATLVKVIQMLIKAYAPSLDSALGVFIPLIVVNCIILGRAEAYAMKNGPILSAFDGIGMGLGFTVGLTCIGVVREIIGAGQAFGYQLLPLADEAAGKAGYVPVTIFILAPGAFLVLAGLVALQNRIKRKAAQKGKKVTETAGCDEGGCASCGGCSGKVFPTGNEE